MEITGTLARIETYFEEWHRKKYNELHQSTIQSIETLMANSTDNIARQKILDLANLISKKLDGNATQITNINDISNILSKVEATNNSINLKAINQRLTALDAANTGLVSQILNKLGTDTTNGSQTIYQRLKSLESTSLSTTNVNNLIATAISQAFNGNNILANEDLNNYTTPGIYKCPSDTTVRTLTHCPTNYAFNLIVLRETNQNAVRQILSIYNHSSNANNIWVRNYYAPASVQWSEWTELYGEHNTQSFDMEVEFSSDGSKKVYTVLATEIKNKTG